MAKDTMHTYRVTQRSGAKVPPKPASVGDRSVEGDDPRRGKDLFFFDNRAYISYIPEDSWKVSGRFFAQAQKLIEGNKTTANCNLKDISFLARLIVGLKKDRQNLGTLLAYYADTRSEALDVIKSMLDAPGDKVNRREAARWYKETLDEEPPLG